MVNNKKNHQEYNWTEFWQRRPIILEKLFSWYESKICIKTLKGLRINTCLELGGGPGYMAKLIAQKLGYDLTLIDNNKEAHNFFKKISNFGSYILGDYFSYISEKKFDLVLSFGVIEHYSNKKRRRQLIKIHQKLSGKYVLIFVPKDCFLVRDFFHFPEKGYEKLYRKEELEQELRKSGLKIIKFAQNIRAIGYLCEID